MLPKRTFLLQPNPTRNPDPLFRNYRYCVELELPCAHGVVFTSRRLAGRWTTHGRL